MADKLTDTLVESLTEAPEGKTFPVLDGSAQRATIPQWDNVSANYTISADTDSDDGFVVPATAPVTEIGRVGANYHSGNIKSVRLIDHSPLQGARFMPGDGVSRYAAIPEITLAGDFEIEFDCFTNSTSSLQTIVGDLSANTNFIRITNIDTGPAVVVRINDLEKSYFFSGAVGQHFSVKIVRSGTDVDVFVDGVLSASKSDPAWSAAFAVDVLYALGSLGQFNAGTLANLTIRDLETGQVWQYNNRNDSGNLLINSNPATAEGATLNTTAPTSYIGSGWAQQDDGSYLHTGVVAGEVRFDGELIEGSHYLVEFVVSGGGTGNVQLGGPPITNNRLSFSGSGTYRGVVPAESVASVNSIRINTASDGCRISVLAVKEVTHGLWHQSGAAMTNAAADAARTRLPMISRHYLFDEPGRIKEVLGGGADATLINLDASDWQAE